MCRAACSMTLFLACLLPAIVFSAEGPPRGSSAASDSVRFVMHRVGTFRGEVCGVADFNGDGKLDIAAGPFVYVAPDWKPVEIRKLAGSVDQAGKGYYHDFANLPLDVDGDGRLDIVSAFWHEKRTSWFSNIGLAGQLWPENVIEENGNFEAADLWDIDGDGKRLEVLPHTQRTVWYELAKRPDGSRGFTVHVVSEKKMEYGAGVGDINRDGRPDIIRPNAWFEAPADPRHGTWREHPLAIGSIEEGKAEHTPQILVYDVNGDGLNDIITSSAHKRGIFWYEQLRSGDEISWTRHVIDDTWTQAHSLSLGDINGDGVPDLVTGKRFMAHNGNDPDEFAPLGVYWYELKRGPSPTWTKHIISYHEGIGSGVNNVVVDLDGDGDLDVVVTGKWGGPVWFENKTR
jgi:hypothetical protein